VGGETKTRGLRALRDAGVEHEVVEYLYKQKGAGRAAAAVGWSEDRVVKTLVVRASTGAHLFVLAPASREVSLKKVARALGVAEVVMAAANAAARLTGYAPGGISPFGSYAALPAIVDESLFEHDRVAINAGRRGVLVALDPRAIQALLGAAVEDVST
jgi:Cys-tRNA(Pro)/Cys-tRNA(Cys) deacylase